MPFTDTIYLGTETGQKSGAGVGIIISVGDMLSVNCLSSMKVKKVSRNTQEETQGRNLDMWV